MRTRSIGRGLAALALMWPGLAAADPVRTMLQQGGLPAGPAQTVALGRVLLRAGDPPAWHTHPGIETGYVLAGRMALDVAGRPEILVGPGETFLVPPGLPHAAHAAGGADVMLVATWVTDAGTLATSVAAPR